MKAIFAMLFSVLAMVIMMAATALFINYLEGDILPDTSPWSFISYINLEMLKE